MSDFKLTFLIDKEEDKKRVYNLLRNGSMMNWKDRALQWHVPSDIAEKIAKKESDSEAVWADFIEKEYSVENCNLLQKSIDEKESFWKKISPGFGSFVEEKTKTPLQNYQCILGFHATTSNWFGTRFTAHYKMEDFIIGFEVILSHTFKYTRQYFNKNEVPDWSVWGLGEIVASFFIREPSVIPLFPSFPKDKLLSIEKEGWFTGYENLKPYEKSFRDIYLDEPDFKKFVFESCAYLKQHPIEK